MLAEAHRTVARPPKRSASQPHICCAMNPIASCVDSIAAPCTGPMPMSLQKATICDSGIAIVTQQQKIASASKPMTRLGGKPSTGEVPVAVVAPATFSEGTSGGVRKNTAASGTIVPITSTPYSSMALRQPIIPTASCSTSGHRAPATYCPDETRATSRPSVLIEPARARRPSSARTFLPRQADRRAVSCIGRATHNPTNDATIKPAANMAPQPITTRRTPTRPEIHPIRMPPRPEPIYVSDTASAGADRDVPNSAAIGFIATTVTSGAP